jgi:hypothetical protein
MVLAAKGKAVSDAKTIIHLFIVIFSAVCTLAHASGGLNG